MRRRKLKESEDTVATRIHPTAIIEHDVTIGDGSSIWDNVHIRHGATIGRDCIVGEKSYIAYDVRIGNLVKINAMVYICTAVTIEDGVMISAGTVFTNFLFADKTLYYSRLGEFEAPKGDNWNCGIGVAYQACPKLKLNLALGGTFWKKEAIASQFILPFAVEVKAHAYSVSIGANLDL